MQLNSLKTDHLPSNGLFDWLTANQFTLTIIGLALLALLLLVVAVQLFRRASHPPLRPNWRRLGGSRTATPVAQSSVSGWTLIDVTGQAIPLRPLPFTIGRQGGNALVLDDPSVALHHAMIQNDASWGGLIIEDLDSPGGIQIEGAPTRQNLLQPGMHLTIGRYTFTIQKQAL